MNRIKLSLITLAAAIPAAGALLASAAGPNLVGNGEFSGGLTGWSNFSGNPVVVGGTMELTNNYTDYGNSYYGATTCVTGIQEGQSYTATADVFVGNDQPERGMAGIYLHFRTDAACNGSNLGGGHAANGYHAENRGVWVPLKHTVTAPAGSKAVLIVAAAVKEPLIYADGVPATLKVQIDNVTLKVSDVATPTATATPTQQPTITPTPTQAPATPTATATATSTSTPVASQTEYPKNMDEDGTPEPPKAGDTAPGGITDGKEEKKDDADSKSDVIDDSWMIGHNTSNSGDTNQDNPGGAADDTVVAATDEDGGSVGLGLGLLFIGFGTLITVAGLGFGAIVKRRSNQD